MTWQETGEKKEGVPESSEAKGKVKPILPVMKRIPAGSFLMGSPDSEESRWSVEGPVHKVALQAFELAETEVTFAGWDRCVKAGVCRDVDDRGWGREQRPVINVTWNDAQAYINWLNESERLEGDNRYRLPTEAEWEYAARAGTQTAYFWGNESQCEYANGGDLTLSELEKSEFPYAECKDGHPNTAPVGLFKPNAWSLYDMSGNVWEWVEDCWYDNYRGAPEDGSAWSGTDKKCNRRSVRGGGWYNIPRYLRSAIRYRFRADVASYYSGFRLARTL